MPRLLTHRSFQIAILLLSLLVLLGIIFIVVIPLSPAPIPVPTVVPGPVEVVTIGDSQTAGYGDERVQIPVAGGYPAMLILPVIQLRPGSRVDNLGQGGWTSSDIVQGVKGIPSPLQPALALKPQIICVWVGLNDLLYFNAEDQEQSTLTAFTQNVDMILKTLVGHQATVIIALLDDPSMRPGVRDGSYIKVFDWVKRSTDIKSDFARLTRRTLAFNQVIRQKASQYGVALVDFSNEPLFANPATMSNDGLHPSSKGYKIISRLWLEALLPYLGGSPDILTPTPY